jgi:hypothetical protein
MSLVLNIDSDEGLTAISIPEMGASSIWLKGPHGEVTIGPEDFCELVMYFMTNTDIYFGESRYLLQERIESLALVEGFNGPCTRRFKEE